MLILSAQSKNILMKKIEHNTNKLISKSKTCNPKWQNKSGINNWVLEFFHNDIIESSIFPYQLIVLSLELLHIKQVHFTIRFDISHLVVASCAVKISCVTTSIVTLGHVCVGKGFVCHWWLSIYFQSVNLLLKRLNLLG